MANIEDKAGGFSSRDVTPPDEQGLACLAAIASELGEQAIAAEVQQLVTRINEGRFFVACIGQFKRANRRCSMRWSASLSFPPGLFR